jgi:hypothetical protein
MALDASCCYEVTHRTRLNGFLSRQKGDTATFQLKILPVALLLTVNFGSSIIQRTSIESGWLAAGRRIAQNKR